LPWLVEAWLAGVAFFGLRSAGGFLLLERERRKQSTTPTARVLEICQTLQRRLGLDRTIRYCVCKWLQAPAVIGWFRPIVLLPVTALTGLSEEQLRSVIAHELAHIQRLDPFVNLFQIAVETLLFYHPAVWWLNQRIRAEREHCCDDVAVALCGNPVEYARALTLMEEWRIAPVLVMAANRGPLSERIFRVLGRRPIGSEARGIGLTGGLVCLTAALVAGNALLGIAYPKPTVHASGSSLALRALAPFSQGQFAQVAAASPESNPAPRSAPTAAAEASPARQASAPRAPAAPQADEQQADEQQADEQQPGVASSYIDAMKAAGLSNLTFDQLIALKIQGVTPEYVRGIHEQGLHPDADDLIAMRIQGVTPEYIRDIHALGFKPTIDELIAMRIQDVTPEYIKGLQAAGLKFDVDDVISAKIQGITKEFIESARKHGFQNLTLQKLIQLKQTGILESRAEI
jgi:hypothetical protein